MNTAVSHETERLHPAADTILRLLGVALQIASTLALARTLAIGDTGLFFQGLVVTIAGATFMRAKFDLYISRHIIGRLQRQTGLSTADVLQVLSRRFMTRCCIRSEEHTSELQSLMRISYAVFCLKKKK